MKDIDGYSLEIRRSVLAILGGGNVWHYLAFLNHLKVARHINQTCSRRIQLNYSQERIPHAMPYLTILIPSKIIFQKLKMKILMILQQHSPKVTHPIPGTKTYQNNTTRLQWVPPQAPRPRWASTISTTTSTTSPEGTSREVWKGRKLRKIHGESCRSDTSRA